MAFQPSWWSNINDVSNEMLGNIVKYGKIEDMVSKDRISTRFRPAVDGVLSKIRSFATDTKYFKIRSKEHSINHQDKINQVLTLIKRMPKLSDGFLLEVWHDKDSLPQLAAINQSLRLPCNSDHSFQQPMLSYIKSVKNINPGYDAGMVECVFKLNDAIPLLKKYPDLKLGLEMTGSQMTEPYSQMCRELSLWDDSDRLIGGQSYPSVEHVHVHDGYRHLSGLALLPNLKELFVSSPPLSTTTIKIRAILPYLRSQLRCFWLSLKSWDPDDFVALTAIINNHPLNMFLISTPKKDIPERQVLDVILNSPRDELKIFSTTSFSVHKNRLTVGNDSVIVIEYLERMLLKFKHVKYVLVEKDIDHALSIFKDICLQVESENHRRSIKVSRKPKWSLYSLIKNYDTELAEKLFSLKGKDSIA